MNIDLNELIKIENRDNPIIVNRYQTKDIDITPIDKNISRIKTYYRNINKLNTSIEDIPCITSLRISSDIDLSNLNFCNCKDANGQFDENLVPTNLEYLYYDGNQSQIDPVKDGIFKSYEQFNFYSSVLSAPLKACIMPNMTKVHNGMFGDCRSLISVDISQVSSLGIFAFYDCFNLSYLGPDNKLNKNLKEITHDAFCCCGSLVSVDISQVSSLGDSVFAICSNLSYLGPDNKLNENLKEITPQAFYDCRSLVSVDLNQVSSLGYNAFAGCSKLTKIKLPKLNKTPCEIVHVGQDYTPQKKSTPFNYTTNLSLYYRDPKDVDYSNPDNNDYPKQLFPDTFKGMSGNWAFIMSPAGYKQLVDDIINDKDDLKVAAYKDYLNLGWKSNMGWGNKTPTDKGLANADGKFVQQHIISLADISNESDINSFVRNKNDDIEIEFNTSSKKTIGILKLEKDKNSNKDIAAVITK